ncbi:trigger factor [Rickettsiella massiliensis]|uniref:trigger factor n=1 Tax=Rickettsiella massiliensis TaxID=676517 RepID=UPI00029A4421|nr:trigger factor [Rickettsiella massiliensis]
MKAERGQDLEYIAHFEIYPKVAAPEESQITLEKTVVTFAESDIDEVLARIRLQHAEWIEVPRAAGYGDQVTFDLLYAVRRQRVLLQPFYPRIPRQKKRLKKRQPLPCKLSVCVKPSCLN